MKNRKRIIEGRGNKIIFKTFRLNYPFGHKSKPTETLIKTQETWKERRRR